MRDSRPDNAFLRGTPSHDVLSPHLAQGALENVAATNFRDPRMCVKHESNLSGSWRIQSSYHSRWREPSRPFMWRIGRNRVRPPGPRIFEAFRAVEAQCVFLLPFLLSRTSDTRDEDARCM